MTEREPQRTRKKWSTSPDVFKSAGKGGFTGDAKSGRGWNVSERRPFGGAPTQARKDGKR